MSHSIILALEPLSTGIRLFILKTASCRSSSAILNSALKTRPEPRYGQRFFSSHATEPPEKVILLFIGNLHFMTYFPESTTRCLPIGSSVSSRRVSIVQTPVVQCGNTLTTFAIVKILNFQIAHEPQTRIQCLICQLSFHQFLFGTDGNPFGAYDGTSVFSRVSSLPCPPEKGNGIQ